MVTKRLRRGYEEVTKWLRNDYEEELKFRVRRVRSEEGEFHRGHTGQYAGVGRYIKTIKKKRRKA